MKNANLIADMNLRQSEELERSETAYREGFGNQIEHLKRSALEHIRSRSSEEDRRALLQSLQTESAEQLAKSIENQIQRIKEDVAEENKILELLEAAKEN
uniref:Uncharacterized protein n=1 Tax=Ditylenchus dipsaci TaxID=166011 RepID=A0A915D9F3_9BILA